MVHATGKMHVDGDITTNGQVKSDGDQIAGTISQINHVHPGVERGGDKTKEPE